jgi:hypothetical protein
MQQVTASLKDTRMITKAIKQRWDIPEIYREALITRQVLIATGRISGTTAREETSAFNALLAAESQNQQDEHKVIDVRVQTRHDELAGIAADLGIEVGAIEDAERQADCGIVGTESKSGSEVERR